MSCYSFWMGLVKLGLFFGFTLLLILTLFNVQVASRISRDGMVDVMPRSSIQARAYALNMTTMVLAALGLFGSFFGHKGSLKAFSIFASINAILIMLFISMSPLKQENELYFQALQANMSLFEWDLERTSQLDDRHMEATVAWNSLQSFGCCGLERPEDWNKYRPKGLKPNLYPKYCCSRQRFQPPHPLPPTMSLEEAQIFRFNQKAGPTTGWPEDDSKYCDLPVDWMERPIGCQEQVIWFETVLLRLAFTMALLQVFFAFLASCYQKSLELEETPQSRQHVVMTLSPDTVSKHPLMSAPNGVLVVEQNPQLRYYPNPRHIEQNYQTPPPRYGSTE